jgi:CubicO group peptidase (beta-lactamase class C family)
MPLNVHVGVRACVGALLTVAACRNTGARMSKAGTTPPADAERALETTMSNAAPPLMNDGLPTLAADRVGLSIDRLRAMDRAIRDGAFPKLRAVLIARDGKLVHEAYFGGAGRATLLNTRSVTKTVTGMLIGIAIQRGLLDGPEATITSFFPDKRPFAHPHPSKDAITIEHFLTMSSALECDDWDDASPGNEERMYPLDDWIKFTLDLPVREIESGRARDAERSRSFSYCAAGVTTLGGVLERATKTSVPQFAKDVLFEPLGIEQAAWKFSRLGLALTGGGLELRARDLLKLGQLYLQGGVWEGKQLVPAAWVTRSLEVQARIDDQTDYGYLWWRKSFAANGKRYGTWFMSGNGGNKVAIVPEERLAVVLASVNYNTRGMHDLTHKLLSEHVLAAVEENRPVQ